MPKFLTTRGTSSQIEDIISSAKNEVTLISPYVKIPDTLFQKLKAADKNKVGIRLVYGKDELKPDVKNQLKQLNNLSLRFSKELHAKCFFNEESMVITSMNLYDFSEMNNIEMGILLTVKDDPDIFETARKEAEIIVSTAKKDSLIRSLFSEVAKGTKLIADSVTKAEPRRPRTGSYSHRTSTRQKGYCIRCKRKIPYNLDAPYCRTCFSEWSELGANPDYKEREGKCHTCGRPASVSKVRPQCNSCYKPRR